MARSDPVPDVAILLEDRRWACALARSLVHDEHLAEDIVQSAYLATLDHPPPPKVAPRAWFAGVVRNIARMTLRTGGRQRRREIAAAKPEPVPTPESLVARAEQHHRLAALVLELEEPYRSVVLQRYFGGMDPAVIATHTGEPAATIRSRLKRGLEKLRVRLEEKEGGSWRVILLPLVTDPGAALRTAATTGAGLTFAKILLSSFLLLLAGAIGWRFTTRAGRAEAPKGTPAAARPAGSGTAGALARPDAPQPVKPSRFVETGPAAVTGRVVDGFGVPVPGARVIVFPPDIDRTIAAWSSEPDGAARIGSTDAFGRFEIAPARPSGTVNVYAEHRGFSPSVLESRRPAEDVTIVLEPGPVMSGRVTDFEQKPIAGAKIRWHAVICGVSLVREAASADDGTYRVSDLLTEAQGLLTSQPPAAEVVVSADGWATGYLSPPPADESGVIRLNAVLLPGATVSGTVIDALTSQPLAGARVAFWTQREHTAAPGPMGRSLPDPMPVKGLSEATTDAQGRFQFTQLPMQARSADALGAVRGVFGVVGAIANGYATAIRTVSLTGRNLATDVVLACRPAARIRGQLMDASGRGLGGVGVWLEPRIAAHHFLPSTLATERGVTSTAPDGRFVFDGVRCDSDDPATLEIVARPAGTLGVPFRHKGVVVRAGETTDVGPIFMGSLTSIGVLVTDQTGGPIFGARVSLAPFLDSEDFDGQSVVTDQNGRATLRWAEAPDAAPHLVRVFAQHPGLARGSAFAMTPSNNGHDLRILLAPEHVLRGRVYDENGAPVLDAQVWLVDARCPREQAFAVTTELEAPWQYLPPKYAAVTTTRAGGRFLLRGLAVTKFHVAARARSGWSREAAVLYDVETDGKEIVLKLPAAASVPTATGDLEVAISDAETTRPVIGARVVMARPAGSDFVGAGAMGVHRFGGLPVAAYTLTIQAEGFVERILSAEIKQNATGLIEVRLDRGVGIRGSVARADGLPFSNASIGFFDDDPIVPPFLAAVAEDGRFQIQGLEPSKRYSVVVVEPGPLGVSVFTRLGREKLPLPPDPRKADLKVVVVPASVAWLVLTGATEADALGLLRDGHLVVKNEDGVAIFDRTQVYKTSVPITLPPGSYRASFVRNGVATDEKPFTVVAGESVEVKLALR